MPDFNNTATNKRGLIVYGGEASSDFGIVVAEAPSFDKPKRKSTVYNVPGRSGSVIFQENAYDDVNRSYKVWLAEDKDTDLVSKVHAFTEWIYSKDGYQRLEDSFEPDIFRLGYFNGISDISNEMLQYGETTLSFTCRAERFYKSGEEEMEIHNGSIIYNPTRFEAKPLIYIKGSGAITINVNGLAMIAAVTDYIYIDCDRMNAYRQNGENKNGSISGTFPKLMSGDNLVTITGNATKVTVIPRYYTI